MVVPSLYFYLIVLRHRLSLNQILSLTQSHFDQYDWLVKSPTLEPQTHSHAQLFAQVPGILTWILMLTQEALYPLSHLSSWVFGVVVPESVYCRLAMMKKATILRPLLAIRLGGLQGLQGKKGACQFLPRTCMSLKRAVLFLLASVQSFSRQALTSLDKAGCCACWSHTRKRMHVCAAVCARLKET